MAPDQPSPLALTRHERIHAIVHLGAVLALARTSPHMDGGLRPEADASIRGVEALLAKIREGLK